MSAMEKQRPKEGKRLAGSHREPQPLAQSSSLCRYTEAGQSLPPMLKLLKHSSIVKISGARRGKKIICEKEQ